MAGSSVAAESSDVGGTRRRHPVASYLALVRLPNLFTAPPDVVLGAALAAGAGAAVGPLTVAGLAGSSALLYAAGTTLNDYVDAPEDATSRPDRPIPSGEVSRPGALALGSLLLVGGVAVAAIAGGPTSGAVAAGLALVVVLYDGLFKGGIVGFLFMGGARGTNVLLGTTAGVDPLSLPGRSLAVPLVIVLYIAAVTYMAERETGEGNRNVVRVAVGGVALAAVAALGFVVTGRPDVGAVAAVLVLTAGFAVWTGRPLRDAHADPGPGTIGPAVGACVLGLVILDGAFAVAVGPVWGLGALAFLVPAVGLARIFDVT